jgi:UDP-N-acetylmuramoyl-L-alanyl-D-glutamate--2,6-diaminopimelate ligase
MKLYDLLNDLEFSVVGETTIDVDIRDVKVDSKRVRKGDLFIALKGEHVDSHQFLTEAAEHGASAIIVQDATALATLQSLSIPRIVVPSTRSVYARIAARFFSYPSRYVKIIGITGANGKTTTTFLINHILQRVAPCGLITTIYYDSGLKRVSAKNTTPGPYELNQLLAEMLANNFRYCVMEVSSHALDQCRVHDIDFHAAIFTNLTQDHLDYHHTFENYFSSKEQLFKNYSPGKMCVINADDPYGKRLINDMKDQTNLVTYGVEEGALFRAENIKLTLHGLNFSVRIHDKVFDVKSSLVARHNVYNILAAFAFTYKEGIPVSYILDALATFPGVQGRMEAVICGQPFHVFVDYAHTPDAFGNIFTSVKPLAEHKIITVFGCGGDRDKGKRPMMGALAAEYSDHVIVTADNPRFEDEDAIIADIEVGIKKHSACSYRCIPDRKKAIQEALSIAQKGDVVLILGKGHEEFIIRKDKKTPFSDRTVVQEFLGGHLVNTDVK